MAKCPSKLYPECWLDCPEKESCPDKSGYDDPMTPAQEERFCGIVSQLGQREEDA